MLICIRKAENECSKTTAHSEHLEKEKKVLNDFILLVYLFSPMNLMLGLRDLGSYNDKKRIIVRNNCHEYFWHLVCISQIRSSPG